MDFPNATAHNIFFGNNDRNSKVGCKIFTKKRLKLAWGFAKDSVFKEARCGVG